MEPDTDPITTEPTVTEPTPPEIPETEPTLCLFVETLASAAHEQWRQAADRGYSPLNKPWHLLTPGQRASSSRSTRVTLDLLAEHPELFARPVIIDDPYEGVEQETGTPTVDPAGPASTGEPAVESKPARSFLVGDRVLFTDPDSPAPIKATVIGTTKPNGQTTIRRPDGTTTIVNARCLTPA